MSSSRIGVCLAGIVILSGALAASGKDTDRLLADLGSNQFQIREAAEAQLLAWSRKQPDLAIKRLLAVAAEAEDPEIRVRCRSVLWELAMDEYEKDGEGYLGIQMQDIVVKVPGEERPRTAILVVAVVVDSAASRGGLRAQDVIVSLNDEVWEEQIATVPFGEAIKKHKPRTQVKMEILRRGQVEELDVSLGRRPAVVNNRALGFQRIDIEKAQLQEKEGFFRDWMARQEPDE